ncbi:MAG TPA: dienelactone hydrolase family protein [Kofleriaceae bacterium]
MQTEAISYDVEGTTYIGYLAQPDGGGRGAGVLIAHEGNGLGPQVKDRAHQLAELGYVAFAVDYVGGGQVLPDMQSMMARLGQLRGDPALVRRLARTGLAVLTARPGVEASRIAAIGYCFGGTFALELARDGADIAATVAFHAGLRTANADDAKQIRGKVLACIGASDPLVLPEERFAFEQEMRATQVDWRLEVYGNAVHGFANPLAGKMNNPAVQYHEPTHRRSWHSMLQLFAETIGPASPH